MRYLSVCSGIEAATVAWHPLGWEAAAFAEIEAFPAAVLAHHYPAVPNYGDMTKHKEWDLGAIDLLVGGTPCQSFSVAGLRKGLDDPRGNLMLTYLAIADQRRPRWLVWENVPGVLSSNGGKDFGTFLGALAELGYGFAYRVLDAQFFGVAQRRRRVFVVGYLGDWRPAAAVLFEPESLRGDTAPRRETGQKVAGTFTARVNSGGWGSDVDLAASEYMQPVAKWSPDIANCLSASPAANRSPNVASGQGNVVAVDTFNGFISSCAPTLCTQGDHASGNGAVLWPAQIASTLDTHFGDKMGLENQHVNAGCPLFVPAYGIPGNWIGRQPENGGNSTQFMEEVAPCLTGADKHGVAQPIAFSRNDDGGDATNDLAPTMRVAGNAGGMLGIATAMAVRHPVAPTLTASNDPSRSPQSTEITNQVAAVHAASMVVRRLTCVECERLQGFPDEYTNIPWRKQPTAPDGPRYKALGNSMAVPVMHWIGRRISVYEDVMGKT